QMQSLVVILASMGVLVASQGFGGGGGGRGGQGGQGGFPGGFPGSPGGTAVFPRGPGGFPGAGGLGGGRAHPFFPPPPPFLASVTQEGRQAFFQIFQDQNQTKAQIKTAIDEWAAKYGVSEAVAQFDTEMKAQQAERRANVTTAVGQLAEALVKLNSIEDAQDLSIAATREQIHEALEAMSPELRDLVLAVAGPPRLDRGRGNGMGGGIGGGFPGNGMGGGFPGGQMGGQGGFGGQPQGGFGGQFGGQQGR
ncbi:hypothetical protein PMAYCL1PPCAC_16839, partial [Pristionchus mayeri]